MTFRGFLLRGLNTNHYSTDGGDGNPICAGAATQILGGQHHAPWDCCSWGYNGVGPRLLAAGLIGITHMEDPYWFDKLSFTADAKDMVRIYHKDFTKEVTSRLLNNWTITSDEVLAWIKHRTLPACIKQTK